MTARQILDLFATSGLVLVASACASAHRPPAMPRPFPSVSTAAAPSVPATPEVPVRSLVAVEIVETALAQTGIRYRYGGTSPTDGFDCSGLVRYVYGEHGTTLSRTVIDQFGEGIRIERDALRLGDLVFFSTTGPGATHVGIVVSADSFVHAPDSGGVVRVDRLEHPYWAARWLGARRIARE